jgi:long-chain acyl-CoA synthetase
VSSRRIRAYSNARWWACPTRKTGEAVKVVIVRKDPTLNRESVIEHCRAHLTGYKLPRHVEFRDALVKTPIGKVLRRELRDAPKE